MREGGRKGGREGGREEGREGGREGRKEGLSNIFPGVGPYFRGFPFFLKIHLQCG